MNDHYKYETIDYFYDVYKESMTENDRSLRSYRRIKTVTIYLFETRS